MTSKPVYLQTDHPAHANPTIRINCFNWWVIEYPNDSRAILIIRSAKVKHQFLADCRVADMSEVTTIPIYYYYLATRGFKENVYS